MRTKEEIIERIRRLCEVRTDRGATPQEAEAAAAHAERLLHEYQLTMFDIDAGRFDEGVVEEELRVGGKRIEGWQKDLAGKLCHAYSCKLLLGNGALSFIGHESDVKVVRYFYNVLSAELWDQATAEGSERGLRGAELASYRSAYITGAAESIGARIVAERQGREQTETRETLDRSHALVRVKEAKVDAWISQQYPHLGHSYSRGPNNFDGLRAGQAAGRSIHLRQGIERRGGPKRLERK
jgi:hypothetical protein